MHRILKKLHKGDMQMVKANQTQIWLPIGFEVFESLSPIHKYKLSCFKVVRLWRIIEINVGIVSATSVH